MPLAEADDRAIDRVVGLLRPESRLLFITGAGLSADSGLPTYRGVGGLYEGGLTTTHGLPVEEVLSSAMLKRRPELTWTYLNEIARSARGASPNRGHHVLAEMEGHFADVWILTQNVDGFHRAAGSRQVVDIHGDLHRLICTRCDYDRTVGADDYAEFDVPPRCPSCGAIVRPDVVLFGEGLPMDKLNRFRGRLAEGFSAVFSVGTSSLFPYIEAPVYHARACGTPTVEINPGRTDLSDDVDIKITARAAEALDAIWARYRARRPTP
jgi:NAD-dependent deacetylase